MANHKRARRLKLTAAIAAVAAAAGAALFGTSFANATPEPKMGTIYGADAATAVSGSYIVMLSEKADKAELAKQYGGKLQRSFSSTINGFSANKLSETEAKRLAADPAVAKVVQNKTFRISATQQRPPSWGLDRIDQAQTPGDNAYTYPDSAGDGVTAYVIDTGVRVTHKDFGGRASSGFDAVDRDNDANDGNGHGTHVAGTIAGTSHGVAKKAKIVGVRVLNDSGSGTTDQVIAGIDWVVANRKGPAVANMSLGGGVDPALDAAVRKAVASGVTFAIAAGNEARDATQSSPARVAEAITVASSTVTDGQSSFSNYGPVVDIYAPGSNITSTWHGSDSATNVMSGTSMATPHVAGVAALYLAGHPEATPGEVAAALTRGATQGAISNATPGTTNKLLKVIK
ncbi:S8 family peptidase [Streptomyces anulatus]|uniref:S8 family peptidase n=1 Tax=Streptomyces anulatus TaxID=1892 RepID=UPI0004CB98B3|nr:S8 family peptidase [Streptomyces anulatus]